MFNLIIILLSTMNAETINSNNYRIAKHILNHIDSLENATISHLAQDCFVSISSISRFARSIGFEDYNELRCQLAKWSTLNKTKFHFHDMDKGSKKDAYIDEVILNLVKLKYSLQYDDLLALVEDIEKYDNVSAFGYLQSENIALNLQYDLMTSGKVIHTSIKFSDQISYINEANENNLIIIFSRSGEYLHHAFKRSLPFKHDHRPKIYMITSNEAALEYAFIDKVIYYESGNDYASHPYPLEIIVSLLCSEFANRKSQRKKVEKEFHGPFRI